MVRPPPRLARPALPASLRLVADATGLPRGPSPRLGFRPALGSGRLAPTLERYPDTDPARDVALLVCGSRDWKDHDAVREQLERAVARFGAERLLVIAGGARGADSQAEQAATRLGLAVEVHPARWDRHGRSAGYRRNLEMLDRLADFPHRYVVAFSNGSRGTQHTIDQARRRGIPVRVVGREATAGRGRR
jgi:hypothetical protein